MFVSIYSGVTGRMMFASLLLPPAVLVDGDYYMVELGEINESILARVELNGPGVMVSLDGRDYYHRGESCMKNGKMYLRWNRRVEPEYKWKKEVKMTQYYMHPESGAVDTAENWQSDFMDYKKRDALDEWGADTWDAHLVRVVRDEDGNWVEAE